MKKLMKPLLLIVMATAMFASCDQKMKELQELVVKFNKECPISFGDMVTLNSVMLDNNDVEMKFIANETIAAISVYNNHKEEVKEILTMELSKESSRTLVDQIIDAGANVKFIIVGGQSGMRSEFLITNNDLSVAQERFANMTDKQKLIASNVLGTKIKLPVRLDEITTLVGLSLTEKTLIYKMEINDREVGQNMDFSISFLKSIVLSQIAQSKNNGIVGDRNRQFYQALVDCHQDVKYEYRELQTGKSASFIISIDEIKAALNGRMDNLPTEQDWEELGEALDELEEIYEDYSSPQLFNEKIMDCQWYRHSSGDYSFKYPDFMEYTTYFVGDVPGDVEVFSWEDVELAYWPLLGYWAVDIAEKGNYITQSTTISNVTYKAESKGIYSGYTSDGRIYYLKTKVLDGGEVPHVTVLALIYPKEFKGHMDELTEIVMRW